MFCNKILVSSYTGCSKSLGHILALNMSKTIKEITMHLIYSESLQFQIFHRMFKDSQCEHHYSHATHQADSQISAKMRSSIVLSMVASCNNFRYSALRSTTSFGRGRRIDQCFHDTHKKKSQGVTTGDLGYQRKRTRSSSVAESVFENLRTQNAFSG